jgi:hypothetical protein
MTRQAKFLSMDTFRDGKGQMTPSLIAPLTVGRDGIMDGSPYPMICEILLQSVALLTENGEDMIDALGRGRKNHKRIMDFTNITLGNLTTTGIVGIEIFQLNREDSGLQFIDTGVSSDIVKDILTR